MTDDPIHTDSDHYHLLWENEFVRVLEYLDEPGGSTTPHDHPNSVMVTLSGFRRRLITAGPQRELTLPAGKALWLPAQRHSGHNIGDTPTHTIFVELKGAAAGTPGDGAIGPQVDD